MNRMVYRVTALLSVLGLGSCSLDVKVNTREADSEDLSSPGHDAAFSAGGWDAAASRAQTDAMTLMEVDSGADGDGGHEASVLTSCPASRDDIEEGAQCALPDGSACIWPDQGQGKAGYSGCACGCAATGKLGRWSCSGVHASTGIDCPPEPPANGASCTYGVDKRCSYFFPQSTCHCTADDVWSCQPEHDDWGCLPSGLARDVSVSDLTDTDRAAWCTWFALNFAGGSSGAPVSDDLSDGFADGGASVRCTTRLCIQRISVEACVANLKRGSCSATLGQLEACTRVVGLFCTNGLDPCLPFLHAAGCEETIVQRGDAVDSKCRIPTR